ncbi:hypothetical protein BJV77DRAFT_989972 [Russula vinacea]|nr:hypothetical protein BJV77DRAFT_989972 [Russula vinacea]
MGLSSIQAILSHQYRLYFSGKYHTFITILMYLSCRDRFPALNFPQLAHDSCSW